MYIFTLYSIFMRCLSSSTPWLLAFPVPYSFRGLVALRSAARDGRLLPLVQDPDYLCKVDYQRLWSRRRMNRKPSKQIWANWYPRILCPSTLAGLALELPHPSIGTSQAYGTVKPYMMKDHLAGHGLRAIVPFFCFCIFGSSRNSTKTHS